MSDVFRSRLRERLRERERDGLRERRRRRGEAERRLDRERERVLERLRRCMQIRMPQRPKKIAYIRRCAYRVPSGHQREDVRGLHGGR